MSFSEALVRAFIAPEVKASSAVFMSETTASVSDKVSVQGENFLDKNAQDEGVQGNIAAVVVHSKPLDDEQMQTMATYYSVPATAFVFVETESSSANQPLVIRWFSPSEEIQRCGHGTLAAAYHLFQQNPAWKKLRFSPKYVESIDVTRAQTHQLYIDFPLEPPEPIGTPIMFADLLTIPPLEVYKNQSAYFAVYKNADCIENISVNQQALKLLDPRALIITAPANNPDINSAYDSVYRYFWHGIRGGEDAVTGSAQIGLAPLWSEKLQKHTLVSRQLSNEGGMIYTTITNNRVKVGGFAEYVA